MFATGSPYSPFFTSGLLSEPITSPSPSSSRSSSPDISFGPRRGSLPTDGPAVPAAHDHSTAFYRTRQPKRDTNEFRSFLSLDLAESQSLRSASLKRKTSALSKSTSDQPRFEKFSFLPCLSIPEHPQSLRPPTTPLRSRLSRDSIRGIPSVKPPPSSSLPELPSQPSPSARSFHDRPPRLPSISITPSLELPIIASPTTSTAPVVISRTVAPPVVRVLPQRMMSVRTVKSSSTVSTRVRRVNRSEALARLEGRPKLTTTPTTPTSQRNFMSMSDDEDDLLEADNEDSDEDEEILYKAPFVSTVDVSVPSRPALPHSKRSSSLIPSFSSSMLKKREQKAGTADWFALNSFIDLRNDDENSGWNWRSFIEVSSVS